MRYSFALIALLLTACSGGAEPAYYALNLPTAKSVTAEQTAGERLVVTRVTLPEYLNDMGIAYQQDDVQLTTANQHRWAEALDKQLTRTLLQNLRQQLPDWQWQNGQTAGQSLAQLQVKVRGFHGKADGHAMISGEWTLIRNQQQYSGQFQQEYPLPADGYPALVRELRNGWQHTSQQMVQQLKPLLTTAATHQTE